MTELRDCVEQPGSNYSGFEIIETVGDYSTSAGMEQEYFEKLQKIKRIVHTQTNYNLATVNIIKRILENIPDG